ncbi:MAG: hypothetical protein M1827_001576 [Pycnora praestabilis]|nr:MAG: hypothetical protein M1827_001576 [Pycnora praestabilis]
MRRALMKHVIAAAGTLVVCVSASFGAQHGSSGCTADSFALPAGLTPGGPSQVFTVESKAGGGERRYQLYLPTDYANHVPTSLILAFHGKAQNASEMESQTQLSSPEFNKNAIAVYPQGIKAQWTGDPEAPLPSDVDDMEFVNDLMDHLEERYCIDTSHIFATGFSNGGGLVGLLACHDKTSKRIAAFAAASGAFYQDQALKEPLFSRCTPGRSPIPIMEFHGLKDPVIDYSGVDTPDGPSYALPDWLQGWATRNGCAEDVKNETASLYEGHVQRYSWTCQAHKDIVVHYRIHGFGHGWPTTTPLDNDFQRYGPTYFNATPVIMYYFKQHSLFSKKHAIERNEL